MANLLQGSIVIGSKSKLPNARLTAIVTLAPSHPDKIRVIRGNFESKTTTGARDQYVLLQQARQLSSTITWKFDLKSKLITCANGYFSAGEYSDYLLEFKAYNDLIVVDERKLLPTALRLLLKTGEPFVIAYHIRGEESEQLILQHGFCEKDTDGKVISLFGTLEDVSASQKLNDQLQQLQAQYLLLALSVPSPEPAANQLLLDAVCMQIATPPVAIKLAPNPSLARLHLKEFNENKLPSKGLPFHSAKKTALVAKVKAIIIKMVHGPGEQLGVNFSQFLSEQLHYDYKYLSSLFSEEQGENIQHFLASQKIETAKKFIVSGEFSLTEIAWKLHYSSVGHLSNQFKRITGMSPSQFKILDR